MSFQIGVFEMFSRSSDSAHEPLYNFSSRYSFIALLNIIPMDFQSLVFWGLVYPVWDLRVRMPDVELESLASQEKVPYLCNPSRL